MPFDAIHSKSAYAFPSSKTSSSVTPFITIHLQALPRSFAADHLKFILNSFVIRKESMPGKGALACHPFS